MWSRRARPPSSAGLAQRVCIKRKPLRVRLPRGGWAWESPGGDVGWGALVRSHDQRTDLGKCDGELCAEGGGGGPGWQCSGVFLQAMEGVALERGSDEGQRDGSWEKMLWAPHSLFPPARASHCPSLTGASPSGAVWGQGQ